MIKVEIVEWRYSKIRFTTEVPLLPKKKDEVNVYFKKIWCPCKVIDRSFNFDEDGKFTHVILWVETIDDIFLDENTED